MCCVRLEAKATFPEVPMFDPILMCVPLWVMVFFPSLYLHVVHSKDDTIPYILMFQTCEKRQLFAVNFRRSWDIGIEQYDSDQGGDTPHDDQEENS